MLTAELTPEGLEFETRPGCLTARPRFLATVPLLEGREEADLVELARVMRRGRWGRVRSSGARETTRGSSWSSSTAVSASLNLPGDRTVEIGRAGPRSGGRDRAARRPRAHDGCARDRDRNGAHAQPGGFRGAVSPTGSVCVHAEAPPRLAFHGTPSQSDPAPADALGGEVADPRAEVAARAFAELGLRRP